MSKKVTVFFLVCFLALASGCLEQFCTIDIKNDLSGTYKIEMKIDLNSGANMLYQYLKVANPQQVQGLTMDQFIPLAKAQISMQAQQNLNVQREELKKQLPEGVTLESFDMVNSEDGSSMTTVMSFSFDNVKTLAKLNDVDFSGNSLAQKQGGGMGMGMGASNNGPKFKLEVEETDNYVIIKQIKEENQDVSPEQLQMAESMIPGFTETMKSMVFKLLINTPKNYKIVEDNAEKKKETKLFWKRGSLPDEKEKAPEEVYLKLKKVK